MVAALHPKHWLLAGGFGDSARMLLYSRKHTTAHVCDQLSFPAILRVWKKVSAYGEKGKPGRLWLATSSFLKRRKLVDCFLFITVYILRQVKIGNNRWQHDAHMGKWWWESKGSVALKGFTLREGTLRHQGSEPRNTNVGTYFWWSGGFHPKSLGGNVSLTTRYTDTRLHVRSFYPRAASRIGAPKYEHGEVFLVAWNRSFIPILPR